MSLLTQLQRTMNHDLVISFLETSLGGFQSICRLYLSSDGLLQTAAALQDKLRRGHFKLVDRPSRMLPRIFNPVQLNVDCSAKTPCKTAEGKKTKRGRPARAAVEAGSAAEGDNLAFLLQTLLHQAIGKAILHQLAHLCMHITM